MRIALRTNEPLRCVLLIKRHRFRIVILLLIVAAVSAWFYGNRPTHADLSAWAPADSLAFVEINDLAAVGGGLEQTKAWKVFGPLLGSPAHLAPNRWWTRLARWTGIGSADALLFARAQVAIVLNGAEGAENGSTLVIKPLLTFIIDTHTSQWRMRAAVERHLEDLARKNFGNPVALRKQIQGVELQEWQSEDASRRIVAAFVNTTVVVANDESSVLHSIEATVGRRATLKDDPELQRMRQATEVPNPAAFGFLSQTGVKSLLQAYILNAENRRGVSDDSLTKARLFADTFGGLVKHAGWTAKFIDGEVEDHCSIGLADGVTDKLRVSLVPDRGPDLTELWFVPPDVHSFSIYKFHDGASVWTDLNAVVSSHADLVGAIAARPLLRNLLKTYGIDDPDSFSRGIGTRVQTIRLEEDSPAVLIADVFDRPALEKAVKERLGKNPEIEKLGDADLLVSSTDNWTAGFVANSFLIGPGEDVRRCLQARTSSQSALSSDSFRQAQKIVDVSLPLTAVTFTNDSRAAISFTEAFSSQPRSIFSTNAPAIDQGAHMLPLAVSVLMVKNGSIDWTSRSSFGIGGSIATLLFPEK